MNSILKRTVCLAIIALGLVQLSFSQQPEVKRKVGDLWYEPVKMTLHGEEVIGQRGHLIVRENRTMDSTGTVELVFFHWKSTAEKPGYPVVFLDGGPGSSPSSLAQIPTFYNVFKKLREVGDVILLDQRGVGRSRPNLARAYTESLPLNVFADKAAAQAEFTRRFKADAEYFKSQGIDLSAYNSRESAHDVDDIRKALGAEKVNLVGFSYGTHLSLACLRYHDKNINRVVLFGTEGPNHTEKLPSTSDNAVRRLAKIAAADPEIGKQAPDLYATLKRVLDRFAKEPAKVTVTDRRNNKPVELSISDYGLLFLIMRDLGDSNDLPVFPAWFVTMDRGDYSILTRFAERRYNQFGSGINIMSVMVDGASGATAERRKQIEREAKTSIFGDMVNWPSFSIPGVSEGTDLGDEYRGPVVTSVPTLFVSGELDNNTQPFQAEEVRKTFKTSTHIIVPNAGHESTLTEAPVQQIMADFLNGIDVSNAKFALPPLKFVPIPAAPNP